MKHKEPINFSTRILDVLWGATMLSSLMAVSYRISGRHIQALSLMFMFGMFIIALAKLPQKEIGRPLTRIATYFSG
ncbi:putative holin-like toxin [Paenibacillus sp. HW567]|uniref:putative holin-like toxin n=1 Tax=Paenibacillus sp. HW567 TaxID=1034769 RepID=UPI003FA55957